MDSTRSNNTLTSNLIIPNLHSVPISMALFWISQAICFSSVFQVSFFLSPINIWIFIFPIFISHLESPLFSLSPLFQNCSNLLSVIFWSSILEPLINIWTLDFPYIYKPRLSGSFFSPISFIFPSILLRFSPYFHQPHPFPFRISFPLLSTLQPGFRSGITESINRINWINLTSLCLSPISVILYLTPS